MNSDSKKLKYITKPIFDDIKLFEEEFRNALHSEVRMINMVDAGLVEDLSPIWDKYIAAAL